MWEKTQEITTAIWADTTKMKLWQDDIKLAIWSDWNNLLEQNQITVSLDKREKELSKKRAPEE